MQNDEMVRELEQRFYEEFANVKRCRKHSIPMKRALGNLYFNLYELKRRLPNNIDPFLMMGIEQLMNIISDDFVQDANAHFFGNLYQIEYSLRNGDRGKLQNQLNWTIYDLYTPHIEIFQGQKLDDSLGSAFWERLKGLITVDSSLIKSKDRDFFKLAMINLCSVNSILTDYITMINGEQKKRAEEYLKTCFDTFKEALLTTQRTDGNLSLLSFVYLCLKKDSALLDEKIDSIDKEFYDLYRDFELAVTKLNSYDVTLFLCNFYEIDKEKSVQLFKKMFETLSQTTNLNNRPFYIRLMIFSLQKENLGDLKIRLPITPSYDAVNVADVITKLFPDYFEAKTKPTVEETDLGKLMNYTDAEIRTKLSQILSRTPSIDQDMKEHLEEEARKPHTGHEISDFEVRLKIGESTIYVCFPIKSGREIEKPVPESYVYQIMRPFNHLYKKCVVVFVTARRCSQGLDTYVKQLKALHNLPIEVLQEELLCRLFKFYNQL